MHLADARGQLYERCIVLPLNSDFFYLVLKMLLNAIKLIYFSILKLTRELIIWLNTRFDHSSIIRWITLSTFRTTGPDPLNFILNHLLIITCLVYLLLVIACLYYDTICS